MATMQSLIPRTIYQSDFHPWKLPAKQKQTSMPIPKPIERPSYRPPQMNLEVMQPFKPDVYVPFDLFHRKKTILHQNPHDPIPDVTVEDKIFDSKLKSRRTRPRVYMVPQISLDDVPKAIMYGKHGKNGLVSSMYSSDWKKACEFALENSPLKPEKGEVKTAFKTEDIISNAINKTFPPSRGIVMPMEIGLAKHVPSWETDYPREFVDTTKLFWEKNKNIGECSICNPKPTAQGMTDDEKAELERCLKEYALRTSYALHPPGYTGYIPRLALGTQFRKKTFSKYYPFMTTLMETQGCYEEYQK